MLTDDEKAKAAPMTVHGAPIYTDPPLIRMRPRGAVGMVWWEECRPDDPEGVDYVPAAALAAERARSERLAEALREIGYVGKYAINPRYMASGTMTEIARAALAAMQVDTKGETPR